MATPWSLSRPSQSSNSLSQSPWSLFARLTTSSRLPNWSSCWIILRSSMSLLAPSYLVLVSNQLVALEMPSSFLAYCSASWYFWLTLMPFSITFMMEVIIILLEAPEFESSCLSFSLSSCLSALWCGLIIIVPNKFMNLFPLIHKSKKAQHFANPLNGLMFHSEIDSKREAHSTISYSDGPRSKRNPSEVSSLKIKSNYKFKLNQTESPERENQTVAKSSKVLKPVELFGEGSKEKATLRLKSESSLTFHFPDVEILPLYLIGSYEDISKYKIKANLQKYFRLYFSNGFRHNLGLLNEMVEKYLPLLKQQGMLDQEVERKKWPKEFWEIKKVEELATLMQKYDRPSDYWIKYLLVLIQLYCVPHPTVRESSLQNLLLLTRHHIKHVFEVEQPKTQCVFLLQNGTVVHDFLDIPFSATRLYLACKGQTENETVEPYFKLLSIIKNYKEECKKKGFVGRLRRHFRNEIALNKYNEDSINYEADHSSKQKQRKISLYNAMMILEKKKQNQSSIHTKTLAMTSARPKSREEIWKQSNVESEAQEGTIEPFAFHMYINSHHTELQIRSDFDKYHNLCLKEKDGAGLQQNEILLYILEKHHPAISALSKSRFHAGRVKAIFEVILSEKLSDDRQLSRSTLTWRQFIDFSILASKHLKRLIDIPDCMLLVRSFVEDFLEITVDDYFRDELTAKLYRIMEADSATLSMTEELVWSWLVQNGFVRAGAVQRELLWTYQERSKTFYLFMVSTIFGTYSTTPMDLAFELMI